MDCKRCNTQMVKGKALAQVLSAEIPDFPNQKGLKGQTLSPTDGKIIDCMKCPKCGYSVGENKMYVLIPDWAKEEQDG